MKGLTEAFDPAAVWRVNFFRVEGPSEPRFYSSWQATRTSQPNFHVPEVFGQLISRERPSSNQFHWRFLRIFHMLPTCAN